MMKLRHALALFTLLLSAFMAVPAAAETPAFDWPVGCNLGRDCWIVHHPDADPGPGAKDFRCGALTYDKHKGTDIALRDRASMFRPVPVLAAADGVVLGTRDRVADHLGSQADLKAAKNSGKECGNGVVIDHGQGWTSQYCHLKSGSVQVAWGAKVAVGDTIGQVGQTGLAQFPHLHISVSRDGQVMDPFTGLALGAGCEAGSTGTLWSAAAQKLLPADDAPMLTAVGFRPGRAQYEALLQDASSPATLSSHSAALVLWAFAYGVQAGDVVEFAIQDPLGRSFLRKSVKLDKTQIRAMRFTGRSNNKGILRVGTYTGTVKLIRQRTGAAPIVEIREVGVQLTE
jgi:hypothetical protein